MPKITVLGDLHAKHDNLDKLSELFGFTEQLGQPVIILGDLLDTKELIRGKCLNFYINTFSKSKLQYDIVVGNHDLFSLESEEHALQALSLLPNVRVHDKPHYNSEFNIQFLPYCKKLLIVRDWLEQTPRSRIVCGHFDINSFDYGNGFKCDTGLDSDTFIQFPLILSGHYHKHQIRGNIFYLGTPFAQSFGETNQSKYIMSLDTTTLEYELVETWFPKYMTVEVDCDSTLEHPTLDKINSNRVILRGTRENISKFNKIDYIKYIESPSNVVSSISILETKSIEEQFMVWGLTIKGYSEGLVELGLGVLKDV